jgi:hypothetical protein
VLALVAVAALVCIVLALRRKRKSTVPDAAMEDEVSTIIEDEGTNELDYENPLASDGHFESDSLPGSGGAQSDDLDEGRVDLID